MIYCIYYLFIIMRCFFLQPAFPCQYLNMRHSRFSLRHVLHLTFSLKGGSSESFRLLQRICNTHCILPFWIVSVFFLIKTNCLSSSTILLIASFPLKLSQYSLLPPMYRIIFPVCIYKFKTVSRVCDTPKPYR